jgi:hypothetical protein
MHTRENEWLMKEEEKEWDKDAQSKRCEEELTCMIVKIDFYHNVSNNHYDTCYFFPPRELFH